MKPNEEQRYRIEQLKQQIREATNEDPVFGTMNGCPPDVEEAFLRQILEFESAEKQILFGALQNGGIVLPDPDELDDAQLTLKLWEVIRGLADLGAFLENTDHLSDRELYEYLWCDALVDRVVLTPDNPDNAHYIDGLYAGSEDSMQVYLKYYADDEYRALHRGRVTKMPEKCARPFDRDRHLPT